MLVTGGLVACKEIKSPTFVPALTDIKVCERVENACPPLASACVARRLSSPSILRLNKSQQFCALGRYEGLFSPDDGIDIPPKWVDISNRVRWTVETAGRAAVEIGPNGVYTGRQRSEPLKFFALRDGIEGSSVLQVTEPVLEKVEINPQGEKIVLKGSAQQFECFAQYSGEAACSGLTSSTCNVTQLAEWQSSDEGVYTVNNTDKKGLGKAEALGVADVDCVYTDEATPLKSEIPATMRVCAAENASVAIDPATIAPLPIGGAKILRLLAEFENCNPNGPAGTVTQDLTRSATWISSRPEVATIDADGLVRAIAPGVTEISATFEGLEIQPVQISVINAQLLRVEVGGPIVAFAGLEPVVLFSAMAVFQDPDTLEELDPVDVSETPDTLWASSEPEVLTPITQFNPAFVLQPDAAEGPVTITAMHQGVAGEAVIQILTPVVKALEVTPDLACVGDEVSLGAAVQLTGHAIVDTVDSNGDPLNCSVIVTDVSDWQARPGSVLSQLPIIGEFFDACEEFPSLSTDPTASPAFVTNTPPKGRVSGNPDESVAAGMACVQTRLQDFEAITPVLVSSDFQAFCEGAFQPTTAPSVPACASVYTASP